MELEVAESMAGEMASWKQVLQAAMDSHTHLKHSSFIQLVLYLLSFSSPPSLPSDALLIASGHSGNQWKAREPNRHLQDGSDQIRIHTDFRSCKIEEIKHCPFGEQREKSWQSISEKSKLQYLGPAPRSPYKELAIGYELDPFAGPLDAFSLLVLEPDQVDYINLKSNERWIFTSMMSDSDKIWMRERVNP